MSGGGRGLAGCFWVLGGHMEVSVTCPAWPHTLTPPLPGIGPQSSLGSFMLSGCIASSPELDGPGQTLSLTHSSSLCTTR